jgi:hypothetical protein
VVSVLTIGPKVRGFKPAENNIFLRGIRIHSTTSLGGQAKSAASCHRIYIMLNIPAECDRDALSPKF